MVRAAGRHDSYTKRRLCSAEFGGDHARRLGWRRSPQREYKLAGAWTAAGISDHQNVPTAERKSVAFSEGFYSDGITDSIVVNALCSPVFCSQSPDAVRRNGFKFLSLRPANAYGHPVSIMVRIDRPYSNAPKAVTFDLLTAEAQRFLTNLDMTGLSGEFQ